MIVGANMSTEAVVLFAIGDINAANSNTIRVCRKALVRRGKGAIWPLTFLQDLRYNRHPSSKTD